MVCSQFVVHDDRLYPAWCLSLYGPRRGEVIGLRWCDIDLDAATITIRKTRIIVKGIPTVCRLGSHCGRGQELVESSGDLRLDCWVGAAAVSKGCRMSNVRR